MNIKPILCLFFTVLMFNVSISSSSGDQAISDFDTIVQKKGQPIKGLSQKHPVKIAFATPLKQVSDYWRRSIDSFKGRMDEIGIDYTIVEFSTRADENRKLKESIQSALETNPDYLVLTLNDPGDKLVISRLLGSSKIKVIIQNITIPVDDWKENPPFMYVGFDHTIGATRIAQEYINRFMEKSNIEYAMLYYIKGSKVSELRGDFFNEVIAEQTSFKLVAEYYTGGSRERARYAAFKILDNYPSLDFIHACSTDVAFGAMDALKERQLTGKILVNGWGGGAAELEALLSKGLDFTVMRMNDDNGVAMAEAIRLDLQSEIDTHPIIYSGKIIVVKQGIEENDLIKLKTKAFRYSGSEP